MDGYRKDIYLNLALMCITEGIEYVHLKVDVCISEGVFIISFLE